MFSCRRFYAVTMTLSRSGGHSAVTMPLKKKKERKKNPACPDSEQRKKQGGPASLPMTQSLTGREEEAGREGRNSQQNCCVFVFVELKGTAVMPARKWHH